MEKTLVCLAASVLLQMAASVVDVQPLSAGATDSAPPIVAELNLEGGPEGPVLDGVKPNPAVDRRFTRAMSWGEEWTSALVAPKRWKMASNMAVVCEKPELLEKVLGKRPPAGQSFVLEHPKQDDRCLITGDLLWKDYSVEAAIRVMGRKTKANPDNDVHVVPMAGIMFRAQTVRHHYYFTVEPTSGFRLYWRDDDDWNVLASSAAQIDAQRYYKLRVCVSGNMLRCFEGDRKLFELEDRHLAYGKAAVRFNTEARVAYVRVSMTPTERESARQALAAREREEQELSRKLPRPVLWKTIDLRPFGGAPLGFVPTRDARQKDMILAGRGEKGAAIMAVTLEGKKLWECPGSMRIPQIGGPLKDGSYRLTGILAQPGKDEVLAAIDLRKGRIAAESPLPIVDGNKPKFMFSTNSLADLRGGCARCDFLLRDGDDGNMLWAYDDHLHLLWTTKVVPNFGHGNSIGVWDVNGDGKDEILAGGTLLGPDGKPIWQMEGLQGVLKKHGGVHIDAAVIGNLADDPTIDPVVSLQAGSAGVYFLDGRTGKIRAMTRVGHAQGRYVGKFRPEVSGIQVEAGNRWGNYGIITIFSAKGQRLCTFQPDTLSQGGPPVNWTGDGQEHIFIYTSRQSLGFYDGWGRRVLRFADGQLPEGIGYARGVVFVEDFSGDPRDELAFSVDGKLHIYTQDRPAPNPAKVYAPVRRCNISYPGWSSAVR